MQVFECSFILSENNYHAQTARSACLAVVDVHIISFGRPVWYKYRNAWTRLLLQGSGLQMTAVGFPVWQQLAISQHLQMRFSLENLSRNKPPYWPSDQHPWTGSFLSGSASPPPHSSATSCLCQLHLSHRPQWHTHRQTHTCCLMLIHSLFFSDLYMQ